jgi:hypothetical protein
MCPIRDRKTEEGIVKGKLERSMNGYEEDIFKARQYLYRRHLPVRAVKRIWNRSLRRTWRQRYEKEES